MRFRYLIIKNDPVPQLLLCMLYCRFEWIIADENNCVLSISIYDTNNVPRINDEMTTFGREVEMEPNRRDYYMEMCDVFGVSVDTEGGCDFVQTCISRVGTRSLLKTPDLFALSA